MARLKSKTIHGRKYWYVVESRRVGGKVKTIHRAYLGRAEDLLDRLQQRQATERLKSFSHGGVAVLLSLAERLRLVELIDQHLRPPRRSRPARRLLSVGQTLLLAAIGRALHPTSKRGWADWAQTTTLGWLWRFDPRQIDSPFFWDQMDRLGVEALETIQAELGRRVLREFGISPDSLFYDVTNYYTFIDSRNRRCHLPQRGKNKQKRYDLRQFQMGMLVAQDGWVPLLAKLYAGNRNDVSTFPEALEAIARQCGALGLAPGAVTLVADKGNVSQKNWGLLDATAFGYVVSLTPSQHKDWAARPLEAFTTCQVPEVGEMRLLRGQTPIAGRPRTVVVLDSPTLRDGQLRGLTQQLQPVLRALTGLQDALRTATRRRRREVIERQVQGVLRNTPTVRRLVRYELTERDGDSGFWRFDWWLDVETYEHLRDRQFGRRMLATSRDGWATEQIVAAYWRQAEAELVFRAMKAPECLALRPQYHWTDQKIEVHSFCCVVGYLLASLVRRQARAMGYPQDVTGLLTMLNGVRMVLRTDATGRPGRPRVQWQLEETDPEVLRFYQSLVHADYELGPTAPKP